MEENIVLLVHIVVALAIIGLILMQQGKGAEMGASFGSGASQTLFGSSGSGNFFSKVTAGLVAVFFVTSFSLAVIAKQQTSVEVDVLPALEEVDVPVLESGSTADDVPVVESVDASDDVPAVDTAETAEDDVPVVPASE